MANLKDLIVQGASRFIGIVRGSKFVTDGGTSSQFVKGDGTLDDTNYGTYSKPSGGIPKTDLASAVQTSLGKADTALQSFTETDPTVPSWAKASTKPTYTASEVGALPSTTAIPSKTSDLTNDSGFITTSDISGVYKYKGTKTNYSDLPASGNVTGDVWNVTNANGNIPAGTNYAWNGTAWDALGGSVDLSGYVPTSRTINGKPLSANITLSASDVSALPSSTTIPTALADLTADATHRLVTDTEKSTWNGKYSKPSGGIPKTDLASAVQTSLGKADTALQSESDPVFAASAAAGITSSDITNWNGKTGNTGTITSVVTTAGAHTTINKTSGSAAFNVPTKTSHLTNDSGFLTSHQSIKTVNGNTLVGTGNVTIPTPNDATLTIKRDGTTLGTFTADSSENKDIELRILQSKTYTGVIGTANTAVGATFYFMSVLPEDRSKPCTIKYRIYASMEGQAEGIEESIVTITFSKNTVLSYDVWNYIVNTSYRPYYYHYRYLSTLAGYNSGYGHLVGVGMRYSYNPATAANARTYVIDILDIRGGTVTFFDTMLKFADVPGTGTTNYSDESTFDATTNGETHSGDRNDVNYQNREYYGSRITNSALYRYMLCLTKFNGSLVPINSVNNSIATNKTLTTDSFDPFGEIFIWSSTTTYTAGANVGDGALYRQMTQDLRYSFNCGGYDSTGTLVGRLPLYLVAVPQSDGTAVLHSNPLSQALPNTEDGLIYIYLGTVYPDTYPYRINLSLNHPIYYYKDQAARLWIGRNYVSQETDPVFSASPAANITSSNITNWNNKENTSNKVTNISASSTDSQYPSAKCVYDAIQDLDSDYIFEEGPDIYDDVSIVNNNYYFVEGSQQYNDF